MPSYLVIYDLLKEDEHDYSKLWAELRRLKGHKTQLSMWLVASTGSARRLHDTIKGFMHERDRLWVAEFQDDRHWFSNAIGGTNKWIEDNPPRECN